MLAAQQAAACATDTPKVLAGGSMTYHLRSATARFFHAEVDIAMYLLLFFIDSGRKARNASPCDQALHPALTLSRAFLCTTFEFRYQL